MSSFKGKEWPGLQASGSSSRPRVNESGLSSVAVSGSSTPNLNPQITDIYRPIAGAIQKSISHLIPISTTTPQPPSVSELLNLDPASYAGRLKGKAILLDTPNMPPPQPSALIRGKKLHKGHPELKKRVREEIRHKEEERRVDGLEGVRKVRRKLKERETGAVLGSGMNIQYSSLLPLNHMHLTYLTHLLQLPPLPPSLPQITVTSNQLPPGISPEGIQSRLSKADLTGLSISVNSARNPSLVNCSGIIIEETSSTFRLVSPLSKLIVIPKSGTLFEILIPAFAPPQFDSAGELYKQKDGERPAPLDWEEHKRVCPQIRVLLLGTAFGFRSGERAGRKFRPAQGGGGGSGWGEEWVQGEWAGVLEGLEKDLEARAAGGRKAEGKKVYVEKKGKRKRGKSRRKDPPAWGRLEMP